MTTAVKTLRMLTIAALFASGGTLAADKQDSSDAKTGAGSTSKDSPAAQTSEGKIHNTSKDCATLSGKEYDECIQPTPAGPVDLRTGEGSKAKSEVAIERKEQDAQQNGDASVPSQSRDTVGHPESAGTTGEAQTLKEPGRPQSR